MEVLKQIMEEKIVAIIRGLELEQTVRTAGALKEGDVYKRQGMNVVEVDKEAFKANAQSIYDDYADIWGDWLGIAQSYNK